MLLLAFAGLAFGQGIITGSIAGSVTDPTGAVISGANVAAKNQETNHKDGVDDREKEKNE